MAAKTKTRLRVGDRVIVVSGAHKGETGEIQRFNGDRSRVFIESVNVVKRHEKPMAALGRQGGIIEKEASLHVSNVALATADGQASRVGFNYLDNGQKVRIAKKTGEQIEDKARA
jgi:large subunit ribosomal protein L24